MVLLPATLLLAACESNTLLAIDEKGHASITMQIKDEGGLLVSSGTTCKDFEDSATNSFTGDSAKATVTDNSSEGVLDCTLTASSDKSVVDGNVLTETAETYIIKFSGAEAGMAESDLNMLSGFDYKFSFSIETPGAIVRAPGAEIDGNRAIFTDPAALANGIEVEGKKVADGSTSTSGKGLSSPAKESSLTWVYVIVGLVIVGGLVALAVVLLMRKKQTDDTQYAAYSNPNEVPANVCDATPNTAVATPVAPETVAGLNAPVLNSANNNASESCGCACDAEQPVVNQDAATSCELSVQAEDETDKPAEKPEL